VHPELDRVLSSVLGVELRQGKENLYYCPFCHHRKPKLSINTVTYRWKCWTCDARGSRILGLLRRLEVPREEIARLGTLLDLAPSKITVKDDTEAILTLPPEYHPLYIPRSTPEYRQALVYLMNRGVTAQDIVRYRIGYCEEGRYQGRIIMPSFAANGALNYFVGRTWRDNYLNYLTPCISKNLIGLEDQINWHHPIVIVEGIFDAMAVRRNAVPLFGKHVPKKLRERIIMEKVSSIYLALDNDAYKDTIRLAESFMKEGIDVFIVELDGKDPSEIGFPRMQYLIKNATKLNFVDLLQLKMRFV
jgi:DNA primase